MRALTNSAGSVTDRYAYDAFGTDIATSGTGTPNAYRFTGEQQDAALGMYYLRARYDQAGSGRFWTRDTWALDVHNPREWNRYVYVAADPVNGVDPSGLLLSIYGGQLKTSALPIIGISKALVWKIVFVTGLTAIALETNVLLSQRGRNNIRNYIVDEVQRVLPRGGDPCKILEEWYKAARAAGDTQLALDIKVAQKYFNCRAHR